MCQLVCLITRRYVAGIAIPPLNRPSSMKLYVTPMSPYARLARIMVIEKDLSDRV